MDALIDECTDNLIPVISSELINLLECEKRKRKRKI